MNGKDWRSEGQHEGLTGEARARWANRAYGMLSSVSSSVHTAGLLKLGAGVANKRVQVAQQKEETPYKNTQQWSLGLLGRLNSKKALFAS